MFNRKFKLIGTAIGLVAVLLMVLALPGSTQQNPLTRSSVVSAVNSALAATLTAAEGDVFDTDNAKFYSDTRMAFAYIPLHPASRSLQVLKENLDKLFAGEDLDVTLGALYVPDDIPGFLKAGSYTLKLVNKNKAVLVDQEGREVSYATKVNVEDTRGQPGPFHSWQLIVSNPKKFEFLLHLFCVTIIHIVWVWED